MIKLPEDLEKKLMEHYQSCLTLKEANYFDDLVESLRLFASDLGAYKKKGYDVSQYITMLNELNEGR